MHRVVLSVVLALSACAKPAAPQAAVTPEAPQTVTLQFGWQPGWTAAFRATTRNDKDGKVLLTDSEGTLQVTAHAQGLQLDSRTAASRFERREGGQPVDMDPGERQLMEAMASVTAPILVGTDGAFLGVPDREASLAGVSEAADGFIAAKLAEVQDPEARGKAAELMQNLRAALQPQGVVASLEQFMATQWASEVADWTGGTFELGETYEYGFEGMHPSGTALPWKRTFVVRGPEPCHEGERAPACVRIDFRTVADSEVLSALTSAVMRPAMEAAGAAEFEVQAAMLKEGSVLTEPSTLRPWSSRFTDTTETSVTAGGTTQQGRQVSITTSDYVWD